MIRLTSHSPRETQEAGRRLAAFLKPGDIVLLRGYLGTGKTILAKGIAQGLGVSSRAITSSSFILFKEHRTKRFPLYHFDLYRLKTLDEVVMAGFKDYLWGSGVSVVEWPERFERFFGDCLTVDLSITGEMTRMLIVGGRGKRPKEILKLLRHEYHRG
jgi:tRNA threonylcarbamoyladenosine biosynthesis protein TsaE